MTNAEKFKRIFGLEINTIYMDDMCLVFADECIDDCDNCPYGHWANQKYIKPEKENKDKEIKSK